MPQTLPKEAPGQKQKSSQSAPSMQEEVRQWR
jgi:hypothetical protein